MTLPVDFNARNRALVVEQNILVTAPAGSGKTSLLTQRLLALLAVVDEPEEIIAVTFTTKATSEMRGRIIEALELGAGPAPESDHDKVSWKLASRALERDEVREWNLRNNPSRLNICTIDALCAQIAHRAPLLGQLGGSISIADDIQGLYQKAARSLLLDVEEDSAWSGSLEAVLRHIDCRFDRAEELLVSMLAQRDQWLPIVLGAKNSADLRVQLESALCEIRSAGIRRCQDLLRPHGHMVASLSEFAAGNLEGGDFCRGLRTIAESAGVPEEEDAMAWNSLCHFFFKSDGGRRARVDAKLGFPPPSSVKDAGAASVLKQMKIEHSELISSFDDALVQAILTTPLLPPPAYTEDQWDFLQDLFALLPVLAAKLALVFREEGVVDYTEVAAAASKALGGESEPTDLALLLDASIKHMLVDEFQDTNNLQMGMLGKLVAGWGPEEGRSIFLVGDPAQSIYGFRGSNVGLFVEAAKSGIGELSLETVPLTVNFRSTMNIVNWVNSTFKSAFPATEDANMGSIPYRDSDPFHGEEEASGVIMSGFYGDHSRAQEGYQVAASIADCRNDFNGESVAVLVRTRSHLETVIHGLRQLDVPYQAIDIEPLRDRMPIRDLVSLSRAYCHLGDQTAWLSLLRSPLLGLPNNVLRVVASGDRGKTLWTSLRQLEASAFLDGGEMAARVREFVSTMASALETKERKNLPAAIRGLWIALGGPCTLSDENDIDNVDSFFSVLGQFNALTLSPETLDRALDGLYARQTATGDNPVQLMTMHKSKGLQFDHVFLPGLARSTRGDDTRLLAWGRYTTEDGREHMLLSGSPEIGGEDNCLYRFIERTEKERRGLECARLLYVACTRAKKTLHLSFEARVSDEGTPASPSTGSLINCIWKAIKEDVVLVDSPVSPGESGDEPAEVPMYLTQGVSVDQLTFEADLARFGGREVPDNHVLPNLEAETGHHRAEGVLVHRALAQLAGAGALPTADWFNDMHEPWAVQLMTEGVPRFMLGGSMRKVRKAVERTTRDAEGRWLLTGDHASVEIETPVTAVVGGEIAEFRADLVFVSEGVRWVVDYKTHEKAPLESDSALISRVLSSNEAKVIQYRDIWAELGDEPVRCAVYLTALGRLVEVDGSISAAA